MSKFLTVEKAPEALRDGEFTINMPDFVQEIRDSKLKISNIEEAKLTRNNQMRNAFVLMGMRYMNGVFNAFSLPLGKYEGLEYKTEQDISNILVNILSKHTPELIDAALVASIKDRPTDVKIIYFTGPKEKEVLFQKEGITLLHPDEVEAFLDFKTIARTVVTNDSDVKGA